MSSLFGISTALLLLAAATAPGPCSAFTVMPLKTSVVRTTGNPDTTSSPSFLPRTNLPSFKSKAALHNTAAISSDSTATFTNVFDFSAPDQENRDGVSNAIDAFERIDDAIMGGISTSTLRDVPNEEYASWSGVCRIEGGGFCGVRTLPFKEGFNASKSDGVFMDCCLTSDDEPERRVWKMTLRTDPSRGDMVYQGMFKLPKAVAGAGKWTTVKIPFESYQLVRGPRIVAGAPGINVTGGLYQFGISLSKFIPGANATELENFRPGFFELQIKRIGVYSDNEELSEPQSESVVIPETVSEKENKKNRPFIVKFLFPLARVLFFSEKASRRKYAMKILKEKRGLSWFGAVSYGVALRSASNGVVKSILQAFGIIAIDSFRFLLKNILRLCFLYPVQAFNKTVRIVKKSLGMKVKEPILR